MRAIDTFVSRSYFLWYTKGRNEVTVVSEQERIEVCKRLNGVQMTLVTTAKNGATAVAWTFEEGFRRAGVRFDGGGLYAKDV